METREKDTTLVTNGTRNILVNPIDVPEDVSEFLLTHVDERMKTTRLMGTVYLNKFSHELLPKDIHSFARRIFWKKPFSLGNVTITPVPVRHSEKSPTSGVIFTQGEKTVGFFSNVLQIRNGLPKLDVYIGDGTTLERDKVESEKVGHVSIRHQLVWCWEAGISKAIFTNLGEWAKKTNLNKEAKRLSEEFGVKVAFARKDMKLHVDKTISLQRTYPGIVFPSPHGTQIAEGFQKIIVSPIPVKPDALNTPLYIIQDNNVLGILRLTKENGPEDAETVKTTMSDAHNMTNSEWNALCGDTPSVYFYEFRISKLFHPPRRIKSLEAQNSVWTSVSFPEKIRLEGKSFSLLENFLAFTPLGDVHINLPEGASQEIKDTIEREVQRLFPGERKFHYGEYNGDYQFRLIVESKITSEEHNLDHRIKLAKLKVLQKLGGNQ